MSTEVKSTQLWPFCLVIVGLIVLFVGQITQGPLDASQIAELNERIQEQPLVLDSTIVISGGKVALKLEVKPSTTTEASAALGDLFTRFVIDALPDALHYVKGQGRVSFARYFSIGETTFDYSVRVTDGKRLIVSGSKRPSQDYVCFQTPDSDVLFTVRRPAGYRWLHPDFDVPLILN